MIPPADCALGLVGRSPRIAAVRQLIEKSARNRVPVLLLGETGTGKEVAARAVHNACARGQFVPVDCGSLVGTLMESELFGHARGSFSGAIENKKGLVELADGGTAFFDEIGDLPLEMQVKLLRLVQEREFRAVGSLQWRKVDIRIIAATHRNLKAEIAAGRFREDLFYRLNVFVIHLPPLRERREDIPLLVEHFLELGRAAGLHPFSPEPEIMELLTSYDWPGNVRELKHAVDRMAAMYSASGFPAYALPSVLQNLMAESAMRHFSGAIESTAAAPVEDFRVRPPSPVFSIPETEKATIRNALSAAQGERAKAARLLGIGRTTLYRKMKSYGLTCE